ncbi:hypothetical protein R1sor_019733 [Riccia sorocarpa]|uniref:ATP-dependent Clp protease proteolytic subunit n=1 Tax=Riccia sorocarpa TaxID=122646 RepID=A0ABD3IHJ0_9MARC
MPATAGRVRMPANNRVHSSAALQTHGIWQSAIGYDPYAPDQKHQADERGGAPTKAVGGVGITEEQQNAYDSFQGLLALARLTGSSADEVRGAFQCRNFLTAKEEAAASAAVLIDKERGAKGKEGTSQSDRESEETDEDLSDSDEDPEMERALAEKYGWNREKSRGSHGHEKSTLKGERERSRSSKISSKRKKAKRKNLSDEDASDYSSASEDEPKRKRPGKREKRKRDRVSDRDDSNGRERKSNIAPRSGGGPKNNCMVEDMTADVIISQMLLLDAQDPSKDIKLFITSPGGSVTAGMGIYDALKLCRADISTTCFGLAASMGAFLLAAGTRGKRYCMPNARALDVGLQVREMMYHKRKMCKIMSRITGKSEEQIEEDTDRDYFMNASEAKEYGLVDVVIDDGKPGLIAPIGEVKEPPKSKVWQMWTVKEGKARKELPTEEAKARKESELRCTTIRGKLLTYPRIVSRLEPAVYT